MRKITITIDEIDPNDSHYVIKRTYQGEMISENKTLAIDKDTQEIKEHTPSNTLDEFHNWLHNFIPTMKYILPETIHVGHEINAADHNLSGSHHYRCYYLLYVKHDRSIESVLGGKDIKIFKEKADFIKELNEIGWDGKTKLDGTHVIRENKS